MEDPKILFFSYDKCLPCKYVAELLKVINIRIFRKELHIDKIDIETNVALTRKYNITTVPTLIIRNEKLTVNIQEEEIIDAILKAYITSIELD